MLHTGYKETLGSSVEANRAREEQDGADPNERRTFPWLQRPGGMASVALCTADCKPHVSTLGVYISTSPSAH